MSAQVKATLGALLIAALAGPGQARRLAPPATEPDQFFGDWQLDMIADLSSCDAVPAKSTRHVTWRVAAGKKTPLAAVESGAKGDPKNYTGAIVDGTSLRMSAGKAAIVELTPIDREHLVGRGLLVRKGCAIVWQVTATRAAAAPLELGDADPDANFDLARATAGLAGKGKLWAEIATVKGTIRCELFEAAAPVTVANFVGLARGTRAWRDPASGKFVRNRPFYDGLLFHRVIPKFVIQGGDPLSKNSTAAGIGTGGPGYRIADEFQNGMSFDKAGMLAMAHAGPGTGGSQFFITDAPVAHLDGKYSVFGQCGNPDVVSAIANAPRGASDRPSNDITFGVSIVRK